MPSAVPLRWQLFSRALSAPGACCRARRVPPIRRASHDPPLPAPALSQPLLRACLGRYFASRLLVLPRPGSPPLCAGMPHEPWVAQRRAVLLQRAAVRRARVEGVLAFRHARRLAADPLVAFGDAASAAGTLLLRRRVLQVLSSRWRETLARLDAARAARAARQLAERAAAERAFEERARDEMLACDERSHALRGYLACPASDLHAVSARGMGCRARGLAV